MRATVTGREYNGIIKISTFQNTSNRMLGRKPQSVVERAIKATGHGNVFSLKTKKFL